MTITIPLELPGGGVLTLEQVPCNLCGGQEFEPLFSKRDSHLDPLLDHPFPVVACRRCGLACVNPRPVPEAMGFFYPASYYQNRDTPKKLAQFRHELELLPPGAGPLLDVGCAQGDFLRFAREQGRDGHGFEPHATADNPHGLTLFRQWDEVPDGAYNLVTAWAVFEHLHDPRGTLTQVHRVLRPGGRLVFLVPNFDSPINRFMMKEDVPRHLFFFTPATARALLERCGFKLLEVRMDDRIYHTAPRGYLIHRVLRLFGRSFQPHHRRSLWQAARSGAISWPEFLALVPVEHLDRLLQPWITARFKASDRLASMVLFAERLDSPSAKAA